MYRDNVLRKILADVKNGHSVAVIISELREIMADMAHGYMLSQDEETKNRWLIIQEFVKVLEEAE